jgi:starvation-inducible DNA-binding protein
MPNKEIVDKAKEVLSNTFVLYYKSQSYHWNVVGPDFYQLHDFFGHLYEELHDAIDNLAEHIRQFDVFAPGNLSELLEHSTLEELDEGRVPTPQNMVSNLYDMNEKIIESITEAYNMAEEEKMFGYSNYLQDRLTAHFKHRWMLKSIGLKK